MSKERLEEIRQRLVLLHNAADVDDETKSYIFEYLKVEWLIERVQELEEDIEQEYSNHKDLEVSLLKENKRYREIIQDFIDHAEDYNIAKVEKYHLRKALEERSNR